MSPEAEAEIERIIASEPMYGKSFDCYWQAMQFAYADAAEQCRNVNDGAIVIRGDETTMHLCANIIEARAK